MRKESYELMLRGLVENTTAYDRQVADLDAQISQIIKTLNPAE